VAAVELTEDRSAWAVEELSADEARDLKMANVASAQLVETRARRSFMRLAD